MLIILALIVLAVGIAAAVLLSQDSSQAHYASPVVKGVLVFDLLWLLPAFELTKAYYRSLLYEVHDNGIRISSGVWTQTVNHIPYWAVSSVTVKRDVLDRWLEIATLSIHTSSMDGATGVEQRLVGLSDAYEVIADLESALNGYRSARKSIMGDHNKIVRQV